MDKKKWTKTMKSIAKIASMIGISMIVDGAVKNVVPDKKWLGKLFLGIGTAAITDVIFCHAEPIIEDEIDDAVDVVDTLIPTMFAKEETEAEA